MVDVQLCLIQWIYFSILAWEIPGTEEPGGLQSMGSKKFGHERSNLACTWVFRINKKQQKVTIIRNIGRNDVFPIYILGNMYIFNSNCSDTMSYSSHHSFIPSEVKWKLLIMFNSLQLHGWYVHGILQARVLEWVAIPFSRWSSQPRDLTQVSHIAGGFFTSWATWEVAYKPHSRMLPTGKNHL